MMNPSEAIAELAAVVADPDFRTDPAGMLAAWGAVATGEATDGDRYTVTVTAPRPDDGPDQRRMAILDVARRCGRVALRDARALYPHYVDETLRQDLAALCEDGTLYKVGECRWTAYLPW